MKPLLLNLRIRSILAVGLAFFVFAPVAAHDISFGPLPSPPPFDGAAVEGEPLDVAIKAIGPMASQFTDHTVNPPLFGMIQQDVWVARFLTKPRVLKPGLCWERMLVVPLRLGKSPTGGRTWQPHNVRWQDETRVVGAFDPTPTAQSTATEEAACQDLRFFKGEYIYGRLEAPSVTEAWRAGLVFQNLVRAAQGKATLGFALNCQPSGAQICKRTRRTLSQLKLANLQRAFPCENSGDAQDCLQLEVQTRGPGGEAYWNLTVKLTGPESTQATHVTMAFYAPPVI